ncbi:MAG: TIGR04282 family arsenosugar biosynthesis glycosyltransferase, partial [Gemmatimonadales bacterium]
MRRLGVFLLAPIPGRVKARLTAEVGPSAAAEVHWQIGRRIVGQVAGSGYHTTVWFAPAGEAAFVREWLEGLGRIELRPQPPGPLGDRLAHAFARQFADGARRAVLIATDSPGIDRHLVTEAFTALATSDVVLGPTPAGGCYLVALREPHPGLLRGLPGPGPAATAFLVR